MSNWILFSQSAGLMCIPWVLLTAECHAISQHNFHSIIFHSMLIFLSKMRKYRWEILIRNLRLIFGCYCQSGSRARDAVRFVEPRPAAGFSYGSRAVTSTATATATGAAKAAGAAIASVAVTALFVTVWFWHWRICRHLSWTPIREAQALAKQAKRILGVCTLQAASSTARQTASSLCQLPVPNSQFPLRFDSLPVRLPDSIPSVLPDGQRDRGTGRQGTEVRHHRHWNFHYIFQTRTDAWNKSKMPPQFGSAYVAKRVIKMYSYALFLLDITKPEMLCMKL